MNWQQIISLLVVALTLVLLGRWLFRKVRQATRGVCVEDCGCSVNELVRKIPDEQLKRLRDQQVRVRAGQGAHPSSLP